jgi:hypothetical protein
MHCAMPIVMRMTLAETPTCRTCHEQVIWADDIAAMVDGQCGDCHEDGETR